MKHIAILLALLAATLGARAQITLFGKSTSDTFLVSAPYNFFGQNSNASKIIQGLSQNAGTNLLGWQLMSNSLGAGTNLVFTVSGGKLVINATAGSAAWGAITGTLASQTDLQSALDAKGTAANLTIVSNAAVTASNAVVAASNLLNTASNILNAANVATSNLLNTASNILNGVKMGKTNDWSTSQTGSNLTASGFTNTARAVDRMKPTNSTTIDFAQGNAFWVTNTANGTTFFLTNVWTGHTNDFQPVSILVSNAGAYTYKFSNCLAANVWTNVAFGGGARTNLFTLSGTDWHLIARAGISNILMGGTITNLAIPAP